MPKGRKHSFSARDVQIVTLHDYGPGDEIDADATPGPEERTGLSEPLSPLRIPHPGTDMGALIPLASYDLVFRGNRPVILTGESGSGKTTTIRGRLSD